MADPSSLAGHVRTLLPLMVAVAGWYLSSRLAVMAIASQPGATLRRAAAQAIPVLFLALAAAVRGQPQMAIGVIFGSSVAILSLVLGVVIVTAPPDQIAADARRRWVFLLPAALLAFLAGYQSQFSWLHAAALAIEGGVILLVWVDHREVERPSESEPVKAPKPWMTLVGILFAIAIAAGCGWLGVSGAGKLLANSSLPSMSIIAALMLSPGLVISMIGNDSFLAQRRHFTDAVSAQVGFVLINLCLILPLTIVVWFITHRHAQDAPLSFPLIVWRVDSVMLILLGLALLPMALGRWLPGRTEGVLLILLYAAYMMLWRWGTSIG